MSRLVLGPLLRHVGTHRRHRLGRDRQPVHRRGAGPPRAHLDRGRATTTPWSCVEGLAPGTSTPYDVRLDGERGLAAARTRDAAAVAHPHAGRRPAAPARVRVLPLRHPGRGGRRQQLRRRRPGRLRPADDWSPPDDRLARRAAAAGRPGLRRRDLRGDAGDGSARGATSPTPPGDQVRDFEEYTWLYDESWTDPQVRWLLSTLPSSMIFDDHDLRDDWNTSRLLAPRDAGARRGGRSASSAACPRTGSTSTSATSPRRRWPRTTSTSGCAPTTATPSRCCASSPRRRRGGRRRTRARSGPTGATSGGVRLLVIDSRCGRMLDERRPLDGLRGRVRLDRGAARRRLRPPADRHLAAVAAAPGAARPRVLGRAPRRRRRAAAGSPASPRRCAAPRTSSTGRRSGPSFDRLAELFAQVGAGTTPARTARRRPRSACCPATCTTPTPRRRTTASR